MTLDPYDLLLTVGGLAVLGVALLPRILSERPLSYPLVYVAGGILLMLLPIEWVSPLPWRNPEIAERLAELGVIVALTGSGLKVNRRVGWKSWTTTWRLLAITMPLTIGLVAVLGSSLLGLGIAAALLLGAALAPTDPVLAADVQVEEPATGGADDSDHEVPFALTSEAGLNDGLAFPFTNAAIAIALAGTDPAGWALEWAAVDVVYRIACGVAVGYLLGRALAHVIFERPTSRPLAETSEGIVVISTTLLVYGISELLGGYGFLGVFVAAVALRDRERDHEYHQVLHGFSDQAERLLSAIILLALGAAVAGGLFSNVGVATISFALLVVLVVRPVAGLIAQSGCDSSRSEKGAIAFFGIRGIGSIYYLAHGLNEASFGPHEEKLWAATGLVIVASIVIHGVSATPWMRTVVHED